LRHPDRMSVSLDHVVPLSRGGSHSWENVRCAHLSCNVAKGSNDPMGVPVDPAPKTRSPKRSAAGSVPRQRRSDLTPNLARIFAEAMAMRDARDGAMPPG
jgi:hypothetical protein